MRLTRTAFIAGLILARAYGQSSCVNFPVGFIPFTSIYYVTAANSAGDHLVVGVPAPNILSTIGSIPLPAFQNQTFCDAQVQLAPQQLYPNVYVPMSEERAGQFQPFVGLLVDPVTNQPFPNGVIPASRFGTVFAWRIAAARAPSTNKTWSPTGSLNEPPAQGAAVLLPNGKVLVVGGPDVGAGARFGDIYDPASGSFVPTAATLGNQGPYLTATLLNDGRVLIVGEMSLPSLAEFYDPSSGQFLAAPNPIQSHGDGLTATVLKDGRVLIVGGTNLQADESNSGAEVYDPQSKTFALTGPMSTNRWLHTATLLSDGRVLIAGGLSGLGGHLDSTEVFDPSSNTFSPGGSMQEPRFFHFTALLPNGKVLIAGGSAFGDDSAELFDPATNSSVPTGSIGIFVQGAGATLLSSGQVLVAGGKGSSVTNASELYNPATGTFTATGNMVEARASFTATLLPDGRVLAAGGRANSSAVLSSAEIYTPLTQGLITSQSGLTFRVAASSATVAPQNVEVLSPTATIPWTVTVHTYQGGGWLSATPTSGNSSLSAAPVQLSISVNPTGLAAQDYYGVVTLTPTDGKHPPVSIAIVLSIVPAGTSVPPVVTPGGLLFLPAPGATPAPQTFSVSNLTSASVTFTGAGTASAAWFDFSPKSGTIAAAQTASIVVTPSITNLAAGVYQGSIALKFGDGSAQTVDLLLVIPATAAPATAGANPAAATAACTATKLLPVFTSITSGYSTPAAWPNSIDVQVVDDCGTASSSGTVTVSFSDGDSPISLLSTGNGKWSATWAPDHKENGITARADAQNLPLTGSAQVTLGVSSNPNVPIVLAGGAVSAGDYTSSPALGLLVSIFGSGFASKVAGASGFPLPPELGSTSVVLSGRVLPLLFVSDTQVNVAIPYDIQANTSQQLVVQNGNAISVPIPVAVFDSEPAILAFAGNGVGQGLVFKVDSHLNFTLADEHSPAKAGDVLVLYAVGLGAVTPAVKIEDAPPASPLSNTSGQVTVSIGGVPAAVSFAGLTPGFSGLYQVNLTMPSGVKPGNQVPVTISVGGKSGPGNISVAVQ